MAGAFAAMSPATSVYLVSVSSTDDHPSLGREPNLGKQVVHLSKAFIFLALTTCHEHTFVIVVYARRADDYFAI